MKAAEPDVDRMDRTATELFEDGVARLLQPQSPLHLGTPGAGEVDGAVAAEEVRGVQEVDVQGVQALIWYATGQIPHTREVMSGGSVYERPRRNASKKRGGS